MFCTHCGKELSDEAIMCPNCGTPTGNNPVRKPERNTATPQKSTCAIIGFALSTISFVAIIVITTLCIVRRISLEDRLFTICAIAGLVCSIFGLVKAGKNADGVTRALAITGIVLASVAVLYTIIIEAVIIGIRYYY